MDKAILDQKFKVIERCFDLAQQCLEDTPLKIYITSESVCIVEPEFLEFKDDDTDYSKILYQFPHNMTGGGL